MGIPEFRNININNIEVKSFSKISVKKENKKQPFSTKCKRLDNGKCYTANS